MNNFRQLLALLIALALLGIGARIAWSQENPGASSTVQVHMVITDEALRDDSEVPILRPENVQVKQGKTSLNVDHLIPARGDNAALQLFILIDDTCDTSIGNSLNDIRDFINAQPATTVVGVAYMSNASIQIAQNFTNDHATAAKAIRLPRGNLSAMDSPYLSLISLIKGWPEQKVRREVLMVSDGIDRLRSDPTSRAAYSPSYGRATRTYGTHHVYVHWHGYHQSRRGHRQHDGAAIWRDRSRNLRHRGRARGPECLGGPARSRGRGLRSRTRAAENIIL